MKKNELDECFFLHYKYIVYCEPCGYKRIEDDSALRNYSPAADVYRDKSKKNYPHIRLKCPQCGKTIVVKKISGPHYKLVKKMAEDYDKKKREEDMKKRLEEGKPNY